MYGHFATQCVIDYFSRARLTGRRAEIEPLQRTLAKFAMHPANVLLHARAYARGSLSLRSYPDPSSPAFALSSPRSNPMGGRFCVGRWGLRPARGAPDRCAVDVCRRFVDALSTPQKSYKTLCFILRSSLSIPLVDVVDAFDCVPASTLEHVTRRHHPVTPEDLAR